MIAAMKNVLSPSSETMMTDKAARKPWMKSSSETEDPVFASCSAADSELSSLLCLTFSPDSSSGSGSHLTRLVNRYMENKNTNAKLFLSIFILCPAAALEYSTGVHLTGKNFHYSGLHSGML